MSDGAIVAKRSGETRSDGASCIFATLAGETRFVRSEATEKRV